MLKTIAIIAVATALGALSIHLALVQEAGNAVILFPALLALAVAAIEEAV